MGFVSSDFLAVIAVVSLVPALAQAQAGAPAAPATTNPPAATAVAPPPVAPASLAPAPPAPAAPAPAPAPPPAAGPVQLAPIAPQPIQLSPGSSADAKEAEPRRVVDPRAAVKGSPFLDATLSGVWLEQRFGDPIVFGLQGGAYLGEAVRLVLRLEMPSKSSTDSFGYDYDAPQVSTNYFHTNSKAASLLYGASLGFVAASGEGFVFAPGVVFQRSDVEDYGTVLGIAMPFEWVTRRGLRFGIEVDLGRAFGGTVRYTCQQFNGAGDCPVGPTFSGDRGAGRAFALRFQMGFGFNHPRQP
jgi:hypothetical protein